jgi:hypothetical protein
MDIGIAHVTTFPVVPSLPERNSNHTINIDLSSKILGMMTILLTVTSANSDSERQLYTEAVIASREPSYARFYRHGSERFAYELNLSTLFRVGRLPKGKYRLVEVVCHPSSCVATCESLNNQAQGVGRGPWLSLWDLVTLIE